jgi:hypothetical protein
MHIGRVVVTWLDAIPCRIGQISPAFSFRKLALFKNFDASSR